MGTSETLRSVIDAGRTGKRLDELTTARVIGKAAERLHAAQQLAGPGKSVGPMTPSAIAIAADGTVTLDFEKRGSALAYSAPEQVNGGAGDRRSDVFSLGCVMWEALTHQRLFEAMNEAAVKLAVGEREIKSPSEINANIPAELSAMCMKALSRASTDRYGSAKAMGVEIEEFLEEAGYEDSNAKVAQYIGAMKAPAPVMKLPSLTPGAPERAAAAMAVPPTSPSNNVGQKLAAAETKPIELTKPAEPAVAKPAEPVVAKPAEPAVAKPAPSAEPLVAKLAPSVEPLVAKPVVALPSVLTAKPAAPAAPVLPVAASSATLPASPAAIADAAVTQPAAPSSIASSLPPIESVASFAPTATDAATQPLIPPSQNLRATISAAVPPPPAMLGGATIVDAAPAVRESPITPAPETAAPERTNPEGSAPHTANPVDVVSLPKRQHRDSEQVLNKWAWQTDSHDAIVEDDHDYHEPPSRKPLYYAIGAGCGVALLVVVIALASGGSSAAKKPAPTAAKETTETAPAPVPAPQPAKQEPAPAPPQPEVAAQEPPAPAPAPAPEPAKVEPTPAPPTPAPEPPKQEPPPPPVAKAEPPKPAPPKAEPPKVVAKADPPKPAPPKQTPPKQDPPKVVAKADPFKQAPVAHDAPKAKPDVETAYKQGLQQFARGDTQGALASLRTSLAGNPNYPPTWRGLGLVFEKLGEKDQARAAFKRYLQLAPAAGDAEQIKSRMERLGS